MSSRVRVPFASSLLTQPVVALVALRTGTTSATRIRPSRTKTTSRTKYPTLSPILRLDLENFVGVSLRSGTTTKSSSTMTVGVPFLVSHGHLFLDVRSLASADTSGSTDSEAPNKKHWHYPANFEGAVGASKSKKGNSKDRSVRLPPPDMGLFLGDSADRWSISILSSGRPMTTPSPQSPRRERRARRPTWTIATCPSGDATMAL